MVVWKLKESFYLLSWKDFLENNVAIIVIVTTAYCFNCTKFWAAILVREWTLANIFLQAIEGVDSGSLWYYIKCTDPIWLKVLRYEIKRGGKVSLSKIHFLRVIILTYRIIVFVKHPLISEQLVETFKRPWYTSDWLLSNDIISYFLTQSSW